MNGMYGAWMTRRLIALGAVLFLCGQSAAAQGLLRSHPLRPRTMVRSGDSDGTRRAELERRFRQRSEQIIRERLRLTDEQVRKLRGMNAQLAPRRNALFRQQRDAQLALRAELARGNAADQRRVAQLMRQTRDLQQQRFQLQQEEQRDLSGFLSPVQQAQYFGLQEQLRLRVRELRQGRGGDDSPFPVP